MPNKLEKTIAALTVFFFSVTNVVSALPADGVSVIGRRETPSYLQIQIPEDLASVEEIYEAPARLEPRLILHVQNAHGSYEAQTKIKQLLDYLYKTYGFKLLFVEGAAGKLDPEYLRLFSKHDLNLKLADELAKQGELTGPELYLADGPKDVEAMGIEEAELYRQNYDAFRKVFAGRGKTDRFLFRLEQRTEMLASRVFSQDLRRVLSEWIKFRDGRREFLPYVKRLASDAKKCIALDLESLFAQVEWPQTTRLLVLQSMETDLDRAQAEKERIQLIAFLKEKRISSEIIEQIQQLGEKRIAMNRLGSNDQSNDHLPRYLLERLVEEAAPKGFHFHDYPAFSLFAGYLILQSELETRPLFEEIELLFEKILNQLAVKNEEKKLLELSRDVELLKKLFHLELTRKDWVKAEARREQMVPNAIMEKLARLSDSSLRGGEADEAILRPEIATPAKNRGGLAMTGLFTRLNETFDAAFQFYDYARRRETVFYESIEKTMTSRKMEKAVLITGGFHTDGLMDHFREAEINYAVLMPRLTEKIDTTNYVTTMMEDRSTIFDIANLEQAAKMLGVNDRDRLGASSAQEAEIVVNSFLDVLVKNVRWKNSVRNEIRSLGSSKFKDRNVGAELVRTEPRRDIYRIKMPGVARSEQRVYELTISPLNDNDEIGMSIKRSDARLPLPPSSTPKIARPAEVVPSIARAELRSAKDDEKLAGEIAMKLLKRDSSFLGEHIQVALLGGEGHYTTLLKEVLLEYGVSLDWDNLIDKPRAQDLLKLTAKEIQDSRKFRVWRNYIIAFFLGVLISIPFIYGSYERGRRIEIEKQTEELKAGTEELEANTEELEAIMGPKIAAVLSVISDPRRPEEDRFAAGRALAKVTILTPGSMDTVTDGLIAILEDEDVDNISKDIAAHTLGEIGNTKVLGRLEELRNKTRGSVRIYIEDAIQALSKQDPSRSEVREESKEENPYKSPLATDPTRPKKWGRRLGIIMALITVLALGGYGAYRYFASKPKPQNPILNPPEYLRNYPLGREEFIIDDQQKKETLPAEGEKFEEKYHRLDPFGRDDLQRENIELFRSEVRDFSNEFVFAALAVSPLLAMGAHVGLRTLRGWAHIAVLGVMTSRLGKNPTARHFLKRGWILNVAEAFDFDFSTRWLAASIEARVLDAAEEAYRAYLDSLRKSGFWSEDKFEFVSKIRLNHPFYGLTIKFLEDLALGPEAAEVARDVKQFADTYREKILAAKPAETDKPEQVPNISRRAEVRGTNEENPYASPMATKLISPEELAAALRQTVNAERETGWINWIKKRVQRKYRIRNDFIEQVVKRIEKEFEKDMTNTAYTVHFNRALRQWARNYGVLLPPIPTYFERAYGSDPRLPPHLHPHFHIDWFGISLGNYYKTETGFESLWVNLVQRNLIDINTSHLVNLHPKFFYFIAEHIEHSQWNAPLRRAEARRDGGRPDRQPRPNRQVRAEVRDDRSRSEGRVNRQQLQAFVEALLSAAQERGLKTKGLKKMLEKDGLKKARDLYLRQELDQNTVIRILGENKMVREKAQKWAALINGMTGRRVPLPTPDNPPASASVSAGHVDPAVLDPANSRFDIKEWFHRKYEPSLGVLEQTTVTTDQILTWINQMVRPLKPDFEVPAALQPGAPVNSYHLLALSDAIREQVFFPRNFIAQQSAFGRQEQALGKIVQRELVTTPAGRQVRLFIVEPHSPFAFGIAVAHSDHLILSTDGQSLHAETVDHMQRLWQAHQRGSFQPVDFNEDPGQHVTMWVNLYTFGRHSPEEAHRFFREETLAEEMAHSDAYDFIERLLGRGYVKQLPGERAMAGFALLEESELKDQMGNLRFDGQEAYGEAISELEAKLNAMRHITYPVHILLEALHALVFPRTQGQERARRNLEPERYDLAYDLFLRILAEELFGQRTSDPAAWLRYLKSQLHDFDTFNGNLKQAAQTAYPKFFISLSQREAFVGRVLELHREIQAMLAAAGVRSQPQDATLKWFVIDREFGDQAIKMMIQRYLEREGGMNQGLMQQLVEKIQAAARAEVRTQKAELNFADRSLLTPIVSGQKIIIQAGLFAYIVEPTEGVVNFQRVDPQTLTPAGRLRQFDLDSRFTVGRTQGDYLINDFHIANPHFAIRLRRLSQDNFQLMVEHLGSGPTKTIIRIETPSELQAEYDPGKKLNKEQIVEKVRKAMEETPNIMQRGTWLASFLGPNDPIWASVFVLNQETGEVIRNFSINYAPPFPSLGEIQVSVQQLGNGQLVIDEILRAEVRKEVENQNLALDSSLVTRWVRWGTAILRASSTLIRRVSTFVSLSLTSAISSLSGKTTSETARNWLSIFSRIAATWLGVKSLLMGGNVAKEPSDVNIKNYHYKNDNRETLTMPSSVHLPAAESGQIVSPSPGLTARSAGDGDRAEAFDSSEEQTRSGRGPERPKGVERAEMRGGDEAVARLFPEDQKEERTSLLLEQLSLVLRDAEEGEVASVLSAFRTRIENEKIDFSEAWDETSPAFALLVDFEIKGLFADDVDALIPQDETNFLRQFYNAAARRAESRVERMPFSIRKGKSEPPHRGWVKIEVGETEYELITDWSGSRMRIGKKKPWQDVSRDFSHLIGDTIPLLAPVSKYFEQFEGPPLEMEVIYRKNEVLLSFARTFPLDPNMVSLKLDLITGAASILSPSSDSYITPLFRLVISRSAVYATALLPLVQELAPEERDHLGKIVHAYLASEIDPAMAKLLGKGARLEDIQKRAKEVFGENRPNLDEVLKVIRQFARGERAGARSEARAGLTPKEILKAFKDENDFVLSRVGKELNAIVGSSDDFTGGQIKRMSKRYQKLFGNEQFTLKELFLLYDLKHITPSTFSQLASTLIAVMLRSLIKNKNLEGIRRKLEQYFREDSETGGSLLMKTKVVLIKGGFSEEAANQLLSPFWNSLPVDSERDALQNIASMLGGSVAARTADPRESRAYQSLSQILTLAEKDSPAIPDILFDAINHLVSIYLEAFKSNDFETYAGLGSAFFISFSDQYESLEDQPERRSRIFNTWVALLDRSLDERKLSRQSYYSLLGEIISFATQDRHLDVLEKLAEKDHEVRHLILDEIAAEYLIHEFYKTHESALKDIGNVEIDGDYPAGSAFGRVLEKIKGYYNEQSPGFERSIIERFAYGEEGGEKNSRAEVRVTNPSISDEDFPPGSSDRFINAIRFFYDFPSVLASPLFVEGQPDDLRRQTQSEEWARAGNFAGAAALKLSEAFHLIKRHYFVKRLIREHSFVKGVALGEWADYKFQIRQTAVYVGSLLKQANDYYLNLATTEEYTSDPAFRTVHILLPELIKNAEAVVNFMDKKYDQFYLETLSKEKGDESVEEMKSAIMGDLQKTRGFLEVEDDYYHSLTLAESEIEQSAYDVAAWIIENVWRALISPQPGRRLSSARFRKDHPLSRYLQDALQKIHHLSARAEARGEIQIETRRAVEFDTEKRNELMQVYGISIWVPPHPTPLQNNPADPDEIGMMGTSLKDLEAARDEIIGTYGYYDFRKERAEEQGVLYDYETRIAGRGSMKGKTQYIIKLALRRSERPNILGRAAVDKGNDEKLAQFLAKEIHGGRAINEVTNMIPDLLQEEVRGYRVRIKHILVRAQALSRAETREKITVEGPDGPIEWQVSEAAGKMIQRLAGNASTEDGEKEIRAKLRPRAYYDFYYMELFESDPATFLWILEHIYDPSISLTPEERKHILEGIMVMIDFYPKLEMDEHSSFSEDELEAWWYLLIRMLVLQHQLSQRPQESELTQKHIKLVQEVYRFSVGFFIDALERGFTKQNLKSFFELRLHQLAASQPSLRSFIGELLINWEGYAGGNQTPFFEILDQAEEEMEAGKEITPDETIRSLPASAMLRQWIVEKLLKLRNALTPRTEEAVEMWDHPIEYMKRTFSAKETIFLNTGAETNLLYQTSTGDIPNRWKFRLAWLDQMAQSGFKRWAIVSSLQYIQGLQKAWPREEDRPPIQHLVELLEEYLRNPRELPLRDYLGLPTNGMEAPEITGSLKFWKELWDLKNRYKAEVVLFRALEFEEGEEPTNSDFKRFDDWLRQTKGSKRIILGDIDPFPFKADGDRIGAYNDPAIARIEHAQVLEEYNSDIFSLRKALIHVSYQIGQARGWGDQQSASFLLRDNQGLSDFFRGENIPSGLDKGVKQLWLIPQVRSTKIAQINHFNMMVVTTESEKEQQEGPWVPEDVDAGVRGGGPKELVPAGPSGSLSRAEVRADEAVMTIPPELRQVVDEALPSHRLDIIDRLGSTSRKVAGVAGGIFRIPEARAEIKSFAEEIYAATAGTPSVPSRLEQGTSAVIIVTDRVPSPDVRKMDVQLIQRGRGQGVHYVVAPDEPLSNEEFENLTASIGKLQEEKDELGQDIGQRFGVTVIRYPEKRDALVHRTVQQAMAGLSQAIGQMMNMSPETIKTEYSVVVAEGNLKTYIKPDSLPMPVLESASFASNIKLNTVRNTVAKAFIRLKREVEAINQEYEVRVLEGNKILTNGLTGIAQKIWTEIQAAFRTEVAA